MVTGNLPQKLSEGSVTLQSCSQLFDTKIANMECRPKWRLDEITDRIVDLGNVLCYVWQCLLISAILLEFV